MTKAEAIIINQISIISQLLIVWYIITATIMNLKVIKDFKKKMWGRFNQ